MTLPARPGRQIGRALGLVAIVVVLLACNVAFFIDALHAPAALPYGASADAMLRSASTYLVLATALFVCLLAAAFDLVRLIRRMLATLDAMAGTAGRIVAGDPSARTVSRDGCPADLSRFIEHFNAMAQSMKPRNPSDATAAVANGSHVTRTQLAELETRLDAIKVLATDADAASRDALLQHVDALFRFVDDLQVTERQAPAIRAFPR
ncbi:histidine kinase [Burkholderia cenocepacia]|uniref:Histidine kinase n=1 Tax=Burkholderia cenocepacia TaxID=95486 RepID=A0A3Q9F7D4_9BURK|nr:histidine kinase [Burkholderia cenocepacia]AZQ54405.1 histidine kinase [Burkholderia cenocepacia]